MNILERITNEFNLRPNHVENIVELLDQGNTIPFIARYRKELTGHIDDQVLREFSDRLNYLRNLEKRKEEVRSAIEDQGKLTDEIVASLQNAETLTEVEDIYRPYKQKKKTRATVAIAKGLEPLADVIQAQDQRTGNVSDLAAPYVDAEKGVETWQDAVKGAQDIIAERVSDDAELRKKLRRIFMRSGEISSKFAKADQEGAEVYEMYKEYQESVSEVKSHRVLALNRGEKE
ncbi:MAG: RNA-binding transcriptional accessory protein, partial [Clostridia bacterium]|nr:RNA-binding transcriptional accessory protein [Clostridia bacterium]